MFLPGQKSRALRAPHLKITARALGRQRGVTPPAGGRAYDGGRGDGASETIRAQIDANGIVPEAGLEPECPCEGRILNLNQTKIKSQWNQILN
jgi:hypothetical protein